MSTAARARGSRGALAALALLASLGAALALTLGTKTRTPLARAPTTYLFQAEGWLQPVPPQTVTSSDVTLHWTPYPGVRWYDVTVLTQDLSVVRRAFMRQAPTVTVPRSALPNTKLLWQVTVQPQEGERIDSSVFVLNLR